jgi:hypothetical protein
MDLGQDAGAAIASGTAEAGKACCNKAAGFYRPRQPKDSPFYQLIEKYFPTIRSVYEERYQERYGYWRPVIDKVVAEFLRCGDLQEGFARVRCVDCAEELFVAFSCKQRCLCPSGGRLLGP